MAATKTPAASKMDYRSQAIFKFHHPSSLDYIARHGKPKYRILFTSPNIGTIDFCLVKSIAVLLKHSMMVQSYQQDILVDLVPSVSIH